MKDSADYLSRIGATAKRIFIWLFLFIGSYLVVVATITGVRGYGFDEMDWNSDGNTTVEEMLESADIETKIFLSNGKQCTEFYRLKDGLSVKTICK